MKKQKFLPLRIAPADCLTRQQLYFQLDIADTALALIRGRSTDLRNVLVARAEPASPAAKRLLPFADLFRYELHIRTRGDVS